MATKSEDEQFFAPLTYQYYDPSSGALTTTVHSTARERRLRFDRFTDGMSSDFKSPTALHSRKVDEYDVAGVIHRWRKRWPYGAYLDTDIIGPFAYAQVVDSTDVDSMISLVHQKATVKFWSKVKESNLNLAQDLGEYKETTRMVRSMLKFLGNIKKGAIRIGRDLANKPASVVADAWLGYIYGLRPTMSTIHDLATFEARKINSSRRIKSVTGNSVTLTEGSVLDTNGRTTTIHSYGVTYGARLRIPDNDTISRLTSLDPISITWELLPLSFVLDWAVDIGSYLESLEAERRFAGYLSDIYTTTSYRRDSQTMFDMPPPPASFGQYDQKVGYGRINFVEIKRTLLTQPPSAEYPRLEIPRLGYSKIGSLAALIYKFLPRR